MTPNGVREHEAGHKASGRTVLNDFLNFIPGVGLVEGAVDAAQGVWAGVNGDNDAAAKHMFDAAMDVSTSMLGPVGIAANAVKLGYDMGASLKREQGAMPVQAPTAEEAIWDWMLD
jgi:hypothetical protein